MVVGLDPSLTCTSIVAGIRPTMDYSASFSSKNTGTGVLQRMTRFDDLVARIVTYLKGLPKITAIYIEGYSHNSKWGAHTLGEYGGLLRYYLLDLGVVYEVAPTTLKKFAAGAGNAKKPIVAARLAQRYNVELDSDDAYDAYALWRLGCVAQGLFPATTQFEAEAAATVAAMKSNAGQSRQAC